MILCVHFYVSYELIQTKIYFMLNSLVYHTTYSISFHNVSLIKGKLK